ncbi:hypothetical protein DdX_09367 [Ditylenchus destructor]|uniref:Uncharacterized protein n=1 Tax=Ditylenchus destructor TaxID=166010 RepID=A0AAD4N6A0_9BILA|nr:hypothetical protein DdX_09367 [Ditylenchus destructor]
MANPAFLGPVQLGRVLATTREHGAENRFLNGPLGFVPKLEQIAEDAKQTVDVVKVDASLKEARQIFDSIKNDTDTEDTLFDHWHDLQRYIEDVNKCTRDYIMDFSIQLNDLGNKLQNEVELYKQREDEVLFVAENALEKTISAKFKEYRLRKLKDHRTRIQQNHESETALKLMQFREMNEQRDREMKAMDELKTQVSNLKIEFSEQPLIRLKRLAAINDDVLKREQVLILLKAKMDRINNLVEKRKKDEKQQKDVERLEQERKSKAELERIEKKRKLMKRGLLIYQKNLRNDKKGKV